MNIAQVKAKARTLAARREAEIEQEEIEGGEINLIPYLDIVTNLMLFMLASVAAGFVLGQINTTLPKHAPSSAVSPTKPDENPDEQPLQLVVSATPKRVLLWSISKLEGSLSEPKIQIPVMPPARGDIGPRFNLQTLNDALVEIAERRYGKGTTVRKDDTYEIILQVDGDIPYKTVIDLMDYMRRKIPADPKKLGPVHSPSFDANGKELETPEPWDSEKHFLFPDILFAKPSFE